MKIIEAVQGLLSNSEVLRILQERGADGSVLNASALPSERKVYLYVNEHSAGLREPAALGEFLQQLQPFNLSRSEMLAIMNMCPTSPVEVHLMVEDCENRLTDEQVERLLDLVAMHLKH